MSRQQPRVYTFVGEEREVVDPDRYQRALRAWTGYLFQYQVEARVKRRLRKTKSRAG